MKKRQPSLQRGFTIIELLVVMGIIAVLASIVLIALNPAKHFAQARNTQRTSNITAILDAIGQNAADNKGVFTCPSVDPALPTTPTLLKSGTGGHDIAACLVPNYISALPIDPSAANAHYTDAQNYDSGYKVSRDTATGRVTVTAPGAELNQILSTTR